MNTVQENLPKNPALVLPSPHSHRLHVCSWSKPQREGKSVCKLPNQSSQVTIRADACP